MPDPLKECLGESPIRARWGRQSGWFGAGKVILLIGVCGCSLNQQELRTASSDQPQKPGVSPVVFTGRVAPPFDPESVEAGRLATSYLIERGQLSGCHLSRIWRDVAGCWHVEVSHLPKERGEQYCLLLSEKLDVISAETCRRADTVP